MNTLAALIKIEHYDGELENTYLLAPSLLLTLSEKLVSCAISKSILMQAAEFANMHMMQQQTVD